MEQDGLKLMSTITNWYEAGKLQPERVDSDVINSCLVHSETDCQLMAFYALDDYLCSTESPNDDQFASLCMCLKKVALSKQLHEHPDSLFSAFLYSSRWSTEEMALSQLIKKKKPASTYNSQKWLSETQQDCEENILVLHGTWPTGNWWLPNSSFCQYLNTIRWGKVYSQNDYFQWSGKNSDSERKIAADHFAQWLEKHPYIDTVIAHSHGGSVTLLASRMSSLKREIEKVVLLGVPARSDYTPDYRCFKMLRNVYSFKDHVQVPAAAAPHPRGEGRTISDSISSSNWPVDSGNLLTSHSGLHTEQVWQNNALEGLFL